MAVPDFSSFLSPLAPKLGEVEAEIRRLTQSRAFEVNRLAEHVSKGSGKRLRPSMVLLASWFCGCTTSEDVRYGAIFELVHNATLIHDDIIDHATTRRGKPSLNAAWGNTRSVLFGDFLYMQAVKSALEGRNWRMMEIIADVTTRMTEGELIQSEYLYRLDTSRQVYFDVLERKTALLFSGCTECGAVLAERDRQTCAAMARYGLELGRAFQMVDDLLDYTATAEHLGKPAFSDLHEGKLTLPMLTLLERAPEQAGPMVRRVWGADPPAVADDQAARLRELMASHGVLDECRELAAQASRSAAEALPSGDGDPTAAALLTEIPALLLERTR